MDQVVGNSLILTHGILGVVAYVWFTRRWRLLFRIAVALAFGFIWMVLVMYATHYHGFDSDLGSLSLKDASIWMLPLALPIWVPALGLTVLARRLVQCWA